MTSEAIIATLILGGMCVLMWWLARLAKKRMGVGAGTVSGDSLRVVGKRPLDQKNALYVVEIAGGRHILVGASMDGGISKVDDISAEEIERMTAGESRPAKLRVALREPATTEVIDEDSPAQPPFATVGESFGMLLNKAKDARSARRERRTGSD